MPNLIELNLTSTLMASAGTAVLAHSIGAPDPKYAALINLKYAALLGCAAAACFSLANVFALAVRYRESGLVRVCIVFVPCMAASAWMVPEPPWIRVVLAAVAGAAPLGAGGVPVYVRRAGPPNVDV